MPFEMSYRQTTGLSKDTGRVVTRSYIYCARLLTESREKQGVLYNCIKCVMNDYLRDCRSCWRRGNLFGRDRDRLLWCHPAKEQEKESNTERPEEHSGEDEGRINSHGSL